MPITRRQISSTDLYHVTARGINREQIFQQEREKEYFLKILKKYLKKYDVKIYAYCIMSNHIHIIIQAEIEMLSTFMARILAKYATYYNYKHQRNGHVFQNRFGSECIETTAYYWNCLRYIHMNPVKASVVNHVLKYRFSSLREYKRGKSEILCEKAYVFYKKRFSDFKNFLTFHGQSEHHVFLDTAEDTEMQLKDAAMHILNTMYVEEKLTNPIEILEDISLREKYQNRVKEVLKISQRKTDKLYNYVKSSIMTQ